METGIVISTQREYFHTLAGMRGVAALVVVICHLPAYFPFHPGTFGRGAVDLFFLLSGCVIEASYSDKLRNGMTFLQFGYIRFVRLYPLYIFGTLIMLVAIAVASNGRLMYISSYHFVMPQLPLISVLAVFMVPLLNSSAMYPLNMPAWSLFFEIVVNLIYARLISHLTRRSLLAIIGIFACAAFMGIESQGYMSTLTTLSRTAALFFLGVLLYRERRPMLWTPSSSVYSVAAMLLVCAQLLHQYSSVLGGQIISFSVFPIAIWIALQVQPGRLIAKIYDFLGDVSYPIYAVHVPLAALLFALRGPLTPQPWMGPAYVVVLILGSLCLNKYYDAPVRRQLMLRGTRMILIRALKVRKLI